MLSRYHDYCVYSEFSRVLREHRTQCRDDIDFSSYWKDYVWDPMGIPMNRSLQMNLNTTLVAVSGIVALYRLTHKHGTPILETLSAGSKTFVFIEFAIAVIGEVAVHLAYGKKMPQCGAKWTPAEFFDR